MVLLLSFFSFCPFLGGDDRGIDLPFPSLSSVKKEKETVRNMRKRTSKQKATPLYLLFALDHLGSLRFLVLGQPFNQQVPKADFEATQKVGITLGLNHRLRRRDLGAGR